MEALNYSMIFTVAEVANVLNVDKQLIKTIAYKFSEYLNPKANPIKGVSREFNIEDIRIMAYILLYWEADPDIEYIKMGLNTNSHYEIESIDNLVTSATPIFIEPPENIDETWKHGVVFSGFSFADQFYLANSYKHSADKLIDSALEDETAWHFFCPAVYNYRHAIELYLKAITGTTTKSHDLIKLFAEFERYLQSKYNTIPPKWFRNVITSFNGFDPWSTTFRYGGTIQLDEVFVDFRQLKKLMAWLSESFQNIRERQGLPDSKLF